jgi:hypothetical protein
VSVAALRVEFAIHVECTGIMVDDEHILLVEVRSTSQPTYLI